MARNYPDWLKAYVEYASYSEAPPRMHFWSGVSAIAGAIRRRAWINMGYFKWYPNFYIVLVAPPGVVSKSTTAAISMDLLRQVPGIKFGPQVVTWPALVTAFAGANEQFELDGEYLAMSAMTLESSEFGNLVNPQDREMIDLLVNLWDSKQGAFEKVTKGSGTDIVENPWINLIACTTPAWIAGNFPEYVIGGGFTSRCMFVYADKKQKLLAYPFMHIPAGMKEEQQRLIDDLIHIATVICGPYQLDKTALAWGEDWYIKHNAKPPAGLEDDRFGGYLARKQTHIHKTALVIAASQRDERIITGDDLAIAAKMVSDLEPALPEVFAKIGRSEQSVQAERFVKHVHRMGELSLMEAYQHVHTAFPMNTDFEGILSGAIAAGLLERCGVKMADGTIVAGLRKLGTLK